jgi:hypothetical protein
MPQTTAASAVPAAGHVEGLSRRDLVLIVVLGAILHLVFMAGGLADPSRRMDDDSVGYLTLAANLATDGRFGRLVRIDPASAEQWRPDLVRTPGYPAILAAFHLITGRAGIAAVVVQHALVLALTIAIAIWCATVWGRRAGLAAAILLTADLQGLALSSMVLTEALYGVLLVGCVWLTAAIVRQRSHFLAMCAGGLAGASALVRPTSIALPLVLAVVLAAFHRARPGSRLLAPAVTVLLAGSVVIGAWIVRNGVVAGEYTLSTVPRYNLACYQAAGALARSQGMDLDKAADLVCARAGIARQHLRHLPLSGDENARVRAASLGTIRENLGSFVTDYGVSTVNLVAGPEKHVLTVLGLPWISFRGSARTPPPTGTARLVGLSLLGLQVLFLAVLYVLVLRTGMDVMRGTGRPNPEIWISLACAAYVLVLSSGAPGDPRLRWPVIPLLVIVAGATFAQRAATMRR